MMSVNHVPRTDDPSVGREARAGARSVRSADGSGSLHETRSDDIILYRSPPRSRPSQSAVSDPVARYLEEIGQFPLLTPEGERVLASRIAEGRAATERLFAPEGLTSAEKRRLRRIASLGERARSDFVNANLRLVVSVAKRYQASGVPLLDLIQEGNLGLIRAVEKFDHEKGFRFSTYGVWWIRQFVARGIASSRSTVRLPTRLHDDVLRLREAMGQMEQSLGRSPLVGELAEVMNCDPERITELLAVTTDAVSLSTPIGEGEGGELGDLVADPRSGDEVDQVGERLRSEELDGILAVLDERERAIVGLRFGTLDGEPHSVVEVAERLGLSRERIRQLEHRALAKLGHPAWRARTRSLLGD